MRRARLTLLFLPVLLAFLIVAALVLAARDGTVPPAGIETAEGEAFAPRPDAEDGRSRFRDGDAAPILPALAVAHPPSRSADTARLPPPQRRTPVAACFQARAPPAG